MWTIIGIIVAIPIVFIVLNKFSAISNWRGQTDHINTLHQYVLGAMPTGCHRALLRVEHCDDQQKYVDLVKNIPKEGDSYFEVIIPKNCMGDSFDDVVEHLKHQCDSIQVTSEPDNCSVVANCKRDVDLGASICTYIATEVWHLSLNDRLRFRHRGNFIMPIIPWREIKWNTIR